VWAQAADAVVVTAARDQARRDDVEYAAETLRLVGANAVGTVFAERRRAILRGRPQAQPPVDHARPPAYASPRHQPTLRERLEPEPPALEYEEIGTSEPPGRRRTTRRRERPGERGV
jgi:hypothetical protein